MAATGLHPCEGDGTTSTLPGSIVLKGASGSELRIVAVSSLTLPAGTKITVSGTQLLVFLVTTEARLDGALLLNAVADKPGGGARTTAQCADGAGKAGGGDIVNKGPGAGGGGFGAAGGQGGTGGGTPP